jgi:hypothetical protein
MKLKFEDQRNRLRVATYSLQSFWDDCTAILIRRGINGGHPIIFYFFEEKKTDILYKKHFFQMRTLSKQMFMIFMSH